jgi:hypothetical protein
MSRTLAHRARGAAVIGDRGTACRGHPAATSGAGVPRHPGGDLRSADALARPADGPTSRSTATNENHGGFRTPHYWAVRVTETRLVC